VLPDGIRPAEIEVRDGRISAIRPPGQSHPAAAGIDAGDLVVLPGLVDTHVHVNEPGRTDWEGFAHATRAAAAGGVTTIVDMPLNSVPPTTTVEGLAAKREAASGKCHVDVGFWGGVVPGNRSALEPLVRDGVLGFKCFLSASGVPEFDHVVERDLREAMPVIARLGVPLLVHAELPALLREPAGDPRRHATWANSRPPGAEEGAILLLTTLAREFETRVHVVHLAAPDALPVISAARAAGTHVTCETCPHYLCFDAESIPDGATAFKCAPPIRTAVDRDRLWQGLIDGEIDLVASDHSPAPAAMKKLEDGDFLSAWGGIASLQIGISAVWTGMRARGFSIGKLADWMAKAPARLAGLGDVKGRIAEGYDADLVLFDPDADFRVDGHALYHRHPLTPYEGLHLYGKVHTTLLRGEIVYDAQTGTGAPRGRLI
jgi:allantoinase